MFENLGPIPRKPKTENHHLATVHDILEVEALEMGRCHREDLALESIRALFHKEYYKGLIRDMKRVTIRAGLIRDVIRVTRRATKTDLEGFQGGFFCLAVGMAFELCGDSGFRGLALLLL